MDIARMRVIALIGLAALGLAACDKSTPQAGSTPPAAATTAPASVAPKATGSGDYCTLAEKIAVDSGVMANKHFIPLQNETLDMFKAVVDGTLAVKDQLLAALPGQIRPAGVIVVQYFQALKDSNFAAAPPAGFADANKTVNQYGVDACGFVFDK